MLYGILYLTMMAEQKEYQEWILSLPPQIILRYAREYSTRERILSALEYEELSEVQVRALMQSSTPLADIVRYVWDVETNDSIIDCIETLTKDRINGTMPNNGGVDYEKNYI